MKNVRLAQLRPQQSDDPIQPWHAGDRRYRHRASDRAMFFRASRLISPTEQPWNLLTNHDRARDNPDPHSRQIISEGLIRQSPNAPSGLGRISLVRNRRLQGRQMRLPLRHTLFMRKGTPAPPPS